MTTFAIPSPPPTTVAKEKIVRARRLRACIALQAVCDTAYARKVEESAARVGPSTAAYGSAISGIVHALKVRPELAREFEAAALANMAPQHLETERMRSIFDGFRADDEAVRAGMVRVRADGLTKCRRCKSSDVAYYQKQTRSADEPMTVFYQCQVETCMHRWRQG